MGIVKKSRDILLSHLNSALDRAEDPDKMSRLIIAEMEEELRRFRAFCAAKQAEKVRRERELPAAEEAHSRWTERSVQAVEEGRDDLAREALGEKKRAAAREEFLRRELAHLEGVVAASGRTLRAMEEKRDEALRNRRRLVRRSEHARETLLAKRFDGASERAIRYRFEEIERRIEERALPGRSGAAPPSPREERFRKREAEEAVQEELKALKALKKRAPKAGAPR